LKVTGASRGFAGLTRIDCCCRTTAVIPEFAGMSEIPVTSSTPPAGSMSVSATSTTAGVSDRTNTVLGTVIGLVLASGGANTSTRTTPVTDCVPSVTT
jgi:hypothetical protein